MERQEGEKAMGDWDEEIEGFDTEFDDLDEEFDDLDEEFDDFDEEFDDLDEEFDDLDEVFDEFADPLAPLAPLAPEGEDAKGGKSAGRPVCASSTLLAESRHTSTGTSVCVGCSRKEKEVGESCTTEGCAGA